MKKIISLLLAFVLVLSLAIGVLAQDVAKTKSNVCIKGNVEFANDTKLVVTLANVDGITVYYSEFDCVEPNGSYTVHFKYTGDITERAVKVQYAGADVTDGIKSVSAVTDLLKADVKADGTSVNIDIEDKFSYDNGTVLVVSYDENGKLMDVSTAADKAKEDVEVVAEIPDKAKNVKAYCWNTIPDVREYSSAFENLIPKIDIYCHGDSYGATYPDNFYPESGWGGHLGDYFNDRAVVRNFCTSGAWAQSIMSNIQDAKYLKNVEEGKNPTTGMYGWDDWLDMEKSHAFSKGDYVIVSLGLNDASKNGPDDMAPIEWYAMGLEKMVERAKEKEVNLILCSPLQRATIKVDTTSKMFAEKTEEIAKKHNIPYLNVLDALQKQYASECKSDDEVMRKYYLHRDELSKSKALGGWGLTEEQLENHGQDSMKPGGSGTNAHPNIKGADNMARQMVELLKQTDSGLKEYLK